MMRSLCCPCASGSAARISAAVISLMSLLRVSGKFPVWQPHVTDKYLVRAHRVGRFKTLCAAGRNVIVLLHAVSGDAEASYQSASPVQRRGAGEKDYARLVRVFRLSALRAWIGAVEEKQIAERSGRGVGDAGREIRLRAEADGSIRDG